MPSSHSKWVFGYGSLMWNPGFRHLRSLSATLHGYHRRLCIYSHQYRGTPTEPGLVFGLDRGGSCRGMVFEVDAAHWGETLAYLREREQLTNVYIEVVKPMAVEGLAHPVHALAFVVNRTHLQYAGHLADHDILNLVKQGNGKFGRCEDYVNQTVQHLRHMKVRDRRLEKIVNLLATH